jgi:5'-3' exonuclease
MGIPFFYGWLKRRPYVGVLQRNLPSYVSSLLFDLNGLIHEAAQITYAYGEGEDPERRKLIEKADPQVLEAEFYQVLGNKLSEVIIQVQPREMLVLAVDGVAPQGKIAQQRQRRYKAANESIVKDAKETKSVKSNKTEPIFSSNAITPGTEFMRRVDNFLQRWIVANQKGLPNKVIYSSHMVIGEGEHKVAEYIRKGMITGNGAHVIYGMDADLIMLSLMAPLNNLFLMREDIRDVIFIDNLRSAIKQEFGTETAVDDFVSMIFLLGNDFLPHMVTLSDLDESIETLIRIYRMNNQNLTTGSDINWKGYSSFLKALIPEEHRLLEMESKREVKYPSRMMQMATEKITNIDINKADNVKISSKFNLEIFRAAWYDNVFKLKGKNKAVFQKLMPNHEFGVTKTKMIEMIKSYLTGIAWVFRYYKLGMNSVNTDFVYRYHYAPLIADIAVIASQIGEKFTIPQESYVTNPNALLINPVHQLLAVLPLRSRHLLPKEVQFLADKDSIIADYFPSNEILERDGYNTDWQGILLVNFVDMERIINTVNTQVNFSHERLEDFAFRNDFILEKDPNKIAVNESNDRLRSFLQKEKQYRGRGERTYQTQREGGRGTYQRNDSGRGSYQREDSRREGGRGTYQTQREGGRGTYQNQREGGRETYQPQTQRQNTGRGRGRGNNVGRTYTNIQRPVETTEKKPLQVTAPAFVPGQKSLPQLPPFTLPPVVNKPVLQPQPVKKFEL